MTAATASKSRTQAITYAGAPGVGRGEQIVTKNASGADNPNISDTWIHERVPGSGRCRAGLSKADLPRSDALFRPARQIKCPAGAAAGRAAAGKGCAAVCYFHHSRFGAGTRITVKISQLNQNSHLLRRKTPPDLLEIAQSDGGSFFARRSKKTQPFGKMFYGVFLFHS